MSATDLTGERRVAGNTIVTSLAQVATMLLGGVVAIVVVLKFGADAQTDGFFAAYGVYSIAVIIAQSSRTTIVARLLEGESLFDRLDRFLAAGLLLTLAFGIPAAALGGELASVLTGDLGLEAEESARNALLLLWPAAGFQIVAALSAAGLAVRNQFALPGLAYVVGAVVAIGLIFVFDSRFGIDGVALALTVGSAVTAAVTFGRLAYLGYRPRMRPTQSRDALWAVWHLVVGSVGYIMGQLTFVVSVALAARLGEGAVTVYTYAFFAAALVIGSVAGPIGIVLAAPISATWDRRPESLRPYLLDVMRAGLVLVLPVLGLAALVGEDIVDVVLGRALSDEAQTALVLSFLALGGMIVSSVVAPVPTIAVFARGRYTAAAIVSALTWVVHLGVAIAALQADSLPVLAAASSVTTVASLVALLWLVYGRSRLGAVVRLVLIEIARAAAVGVVVFLPLVVVSWIIDSLAWRASAALAGPAIFVIAVRRWLPEHWALCERVIGPLVQHARESRNMPQA